MSYVDSDGPIPSQIGPYRILERIGEGGMGAVYLAEQDHPHRQVALKVIRSDAYSSKHLRRFEHEAEMLGRLLHPGIAQIYQAGTHATPHGMQPYFAMEYVRGEPLDSYARERSLGTRARLELVVRICDAIEHAHQQGVIHRDLKPANILVTKEGQPKVLDFGVARVTDADVRSTTLHTDVGALIGTLAYMSPEQASGDPDQLDTRSDVYTLGVLTFELLTGQLPYRIDRRLVAESVRVIREEEPSRLSTHDRALRGDVETIVAKTLEKDKARRYSSASALADDIRRYLADEPISARPPCARYQLGKFARRNKVLVGGLAAFMLALAAGALVATHQALRARDAERDAKEQTALVTAGLERATKAEKEALAQRDRAAEAEKDALAQRDRANEAEELALDQLERAKIEQAKAAQSAAFLESLFGSIDPYEAEGADTTLLRRVLGGAADRISTELTGQPEVEASIRRTLGGAYKNLALYHEADLHLYQAEALQLDLFGEDDRRTLDTQGAIAELLLARGEPAEAEALERSTVDHLERLFGSDDRDTFERKVSLGATLTRAGKVAEAEALLRDVLARGRAVLGPEDPTTLRAAFALGSARYRAQAYGEAETLFREVASARDASLGPDHPSTLEAQANLSVAVRALGRVEEAEEIERELLAAFTRTFGAEHPVTLSFLSNMAKSLAAKGEHEAAEAMCRDLLATRRRVLGPQHPDVLRTLSALVESLSNQGRYDEAEPLLQEALAGQRAVLGEDHEDTLLSKFRLAVLLKEGFRYAEAAELRPGRRALQPGRDAAGRGRGRARGEAPARGARAAREASLARRALHRFDDQRPGVRARGPGRDRRGGRALRGSARPAAAVRPCAGRVLAPRLRRAPARPRRVRAGRAAAPRAVRARAPGETARLLVDREREVFARPLPRGAVPLRRSRAALARSVREHARGSRRQAFVRRERGLLGGRDVRGLERG